VRSIQSTPLIHLKPESKRLFAKEEQKWLARELHASISEYQAALATNLDRFSRYQSQPEKIPELLAQSADFVEASMRKLLAATARCFRKHQRSNSVNELSRESDPLANRGGGTWRLNSLRI
jgi:hypothetical protein